MNDLSWIEINLSNLKSNIYNLKSLLKPETKFMAVVKANAYGHGMVKIAKAAVEAGADWLGVVNIEEAIRLRQSEAKLPIIVLGFVELRDMVLAAENDISVPIVNLEQLEKIQISKFKSQNDNLKLKVHLKIETGINRLGLQIEEIPKAIEITKNIQSELRTPIVIEGIYSHFASVEEQNIEYAKKQIANFQDIINLLNDKRYAVGDKLIKHISSSAATMLMPESHFDMVRCGIAIYGLWPSAETRDEFLKIRNLKSDSRPELESREILNKSQFSKSKFQNNLTIEQYDNFLKPVLSYKTKIVQIKNVNIGEKIGYGCTYQVKKPMTIAVIPIGYYEGLDRGLSNPGSRGEVLVCGQRCPIVGRICMNMAVIDISRLNFQFSISNFQNNNEVVIIGKQGKEEITVDEIAEKIGTINYEIVTRIPEHIKRIYK